MKNNHIILNNTTTACDFMYRDPFESVVWNYGILFFANGIRKNSHSFLKSFSVLINISPSNIF